MVPLLYTLEDVMSMLFKKNLKFQFFFMVEQLSTLTQCIWIMFTDVDFSVDHQHVLEVFLSPCRIHPVFNAVLPEVSNITFLSLPHRDFTRLCVVDVIFKVFAILHSGTLFRCFFFYKLDNLSLPL